jgi:hypothetical protein
VPAKHEGIATAPCRAIAVAVTGMMVLNKGLLKLVALRSSRSILSDLISFSFFCIPAVIQFYAGILNVSVAQ